jgi:Holliday junction resolvasome RuvABC endonuclease subunit
MRLIAWDQASITSGYSVFEDGKYVDSGIIVKDKKIPIVERIPKMAEAICMKIKEHSPDIVVIEGIQNQGSIKTTLDLARLQGGIMMWCDIKKIPLHILMPSEWRSALKYQQGKFVKREELKQQSLDYIKKHFELEKSEDEAEAICIGAVACNLYTTE